MENLRSYIRRILIEAMQADINNFGLMKSGSGNQMDFILYDVVSFVEKMKREKRMEIDQSIILGTITVEKHSGFGPCHDAWDVTTVAAVKGYGPVMYDIAMGHVPSKTLMPDRANVSASAKAIWKYYKNNRSDVEALPLDTGSRSGLDLVDDGGKKVKKDDCFSMHMGKDSDFLNYAYSAKSGGVATSGAILNHQKLVNALNSHKEGLGKSFEIKLIQKATEYFSSKFISGNT